MNALWQTFRSIGMADILDMAVVSIFIYSLFRLFEWTKAAAVARGLFILGVLYVVARYLGMVLTTWIFHGFFAVFIIALVIIFQEELRRFFERLAVWSARPQAQPFQTNTVDIIVRCVSQCAHERTGALIVLRGRDPLNRHMEGGFDLDGKLSAALLLSIFDIHSEGHDGAVLIDGGRVQKFGLHLPLSKNLPLLAGLGTRHAAAVGITEMTDAMCIVVSEQRGTIGVARRGDFKIMPDPVALAKDLTAYLRAEGGDTTGHWWTIFTRHKTEKMFAGILSLVLWFMFVQGFKPETISYDVPLITRNVPDGLRVRAYSPHKISVTLSGLKRDLDRLDPARLRVHVNLEGQDPGPDRVLVSEDDLRIPPDVRFIEANPPSVEVELIPAAATGS